MIRNKIYTEYFPVTYKITQFNEEERKTLCKWASMFRTECLIRRKEHKSTYNLDHYNADTIIDMIENNHFDNLNLMYLNLIIYRHKYNAFLSIWTFPMLSERMIAACAEDLDWQNLIYR